MKLVLLRRQPITKAAFSFIFEPLEPVRWTAGQSIRLEISAPDYGTNERRFTISSAPYEGVITITTRNSSSEFKQSLFSLQAGDVIDAYGIQGNFQWRGEDNALFVAAGIGITPFYSILKQQLHERKSLAARLIYGHKPEDAPFLEMFETWQQRHPEFWFNDISGQRITATLLHRIVPGFQTKILYLSGPIAAVDELKHCLLDGYTIKEESIKCDRFTGNVAEDV